MLTLLGRFLPVWLPLLIYAIWRMRVRSKAARAGDVIPPFLNKHGWWLIFASLIAVIVLFITLGLSNSPRDGVYVPARYENGQMVPAHVE